MENNEQLTNTKNKNIRTRIIAGVLALATSLGSGLYLLRNNIKISNSEISELTTFINSDNTTNTKENQRNIAEETINNLSKIETYLNLSNTLENLNKKYENKLNNINFGTAKIEENKVIELSNEEYQKLCSDLEIIANSKKEDDKYYQAVGRVIAYSSHINAWLAYNAPKLIYDTILINCTNDIAYSLELDYQRINVDYDANSNQLNIIRNDNSTGETSYNIESDGLRIKDIKKALLLTSKMSEQGAKFLESSDQSIYNEEGICLMTKKETGLVVYKNKEHNKEIEKYLNTIKLMLCSTYEIKSAKFTYDYCINSPVQSVEEETQTNSKINNQELTLSNKKLSLRR